ncbi:MAG TPA: hypothetical protein VLF89_03910 [Candidatus Saccharimonadales bacterium]|nr:hypothetical protein [Candidatus Saccharimonadales bacterium]
MWEKIIENSDKKIDNHFLGNKSSFLGIISIVGVLFAFSVLKAQQPTYADAHHFGSSHIIKVTSNDLDTTSSNPAIVIADGLNKWFLYNDTNDTIDNTLGSFVTGPSTPFFGSGSVQFALGANPMDRKNIATFQFSGTPLSSINHMSFGEYSHSGIAGANEAPYLNFNIDFTGSSSSFQRRLVYIPNINGTIIQDVWQKWDVINNGNALWTWSGYTANGNMWPDSNTNQYRSWTDITTSFPLARLLPVGGWLGIRVGEPGPTNYTANVDFFSITKYHQTITYDFDPIKPTATPTPTVTPTPVKKHCDRDGWKTFINPSFKNQGQCISYIERYHKGYDTDGHKDNHH